MRLTNHYRMIVILLLLTAVLATAGCVMMGLLMGTFACDHPPNGTMTLCFVIGGGFLLVSLLLFALPPLWLAVGIARRQAPFRRRALMGAVVLGIVLIPIGTLAGGYMLFVMLKLDPEGRYFHTPMHE